MAKTGVPVVTSPAVGTTVVAGRVRETPVLTAARADIPMPVRSSARGSKSAYDFSGLTAVGMSFGVANKTREQINPIVSRENKRNCTEMPDPMNPGKAIKTYSARYEAFTVDPKTDPDAAKIRVFRVE